MSIIIHIYTHNYSLYICLKFVYTSINKYISLYEYLQYNIKSCIYIYMCYFRLSVHLPRSNMCTHVNCCLPHMFCALAIFYESTVVYIYISFQCWMTLKPNNETIRRPAGVSCGSCLFVVVLFVLSLVFV